MDELVVAHIDAHMGGVSAGGVCILKEHQVAQLEVRDLVAAGQLLGRGALDGVAHLLEDVLGKAGAVKAAGGGAAPDVGSAEEVVGVVDDLLADGLDGLHGSALAHVGLGVPAGRLGQGQQVGADIAGLAFVLDLVPAAVEADDIGGFAGGQGSQQLAAGVGGAAEVDGGVLYHAVAQVDVLPLLEGDVLGGHIADLEVVVHQIPAVHLSNDDDVVAIGGVGQDLGVGAGLGPQPETVGFDNADAGFQLNGGSAHSQGRENGNCQNGSEESSQQTFHVPCTSVSSRDELFCGQRPLEPYTANIQRRVKPVLFTLFDHAVLGAHIGIGELQLHQHPGGEVEIVLLFGLQDLEHHNVFVGHGAVVNGVILPDQRAALIGQQFFLFGHENLLRTM